jgi:hypothetical protein
MIAAAVVCCSERVLPPAITDRCKTFAESCTLNSASGETMLSFAVQTITVINSHFLILIVTERDTRLRAVQDYWDRVRQAIAARSGR